MKMADFTTRIEVANDEASETRLITDREKDIIRKIVLEEVRNERLIYQQSKRELNEAKKNPADQSLIDEAKEKFEKAYDNLLDISFETSTACEIALRGINSSLKMENDFLREMENQTKRLEEE